MPRNQPVILLLTSSRVSNFKRTGVNVKRRR